MARVSARFTLTANRSAHCGAFDPQCRKPVATTSGAWLPGVDGAIPAEELAALVVGETLDGREDLRLGNELLGAELGYSAATGMSSLARSPIGIVGV